MALVPQGFIPDAPESDVPEGFVPDDIQQEAPPAFFSGLARLPEVAPSLPAQAEIKTERLFQAAPPAGRMALSTIPEPEPEQPAVQPWSPRQITPGPPGQIPERETPVLPPTEPRSTFQKAYYRSLAAMGDWFASPISFASRMSDIGPLKETFDLHEATLKEATEPKTFAQSQELGIAPEQLAKLEVGKRHEAFRKAMLHPFEKALGVYRGGAEAARTVAENIPGNETVAKVAEISAGFLPYVALGAAGGVGLAASVAHAGVSSYDSTIEQAEAAYLNQGLAPEEARKKAGEDALRSGIVNAALFAVLPRATSPLLKPFAKKIATQPPLIRAAAETLASSVHGSLFMGTQSLVNDALTKWTYAPELTWKQALENAAESALAGAVGTAVVHAPMAGLKAVRGTLAERRVFLGPSIFDYQNAALADLQARLGTVPPAMAPKDQVQATLKRITGIMNRWQSMMPRLTKTEQAEFKENLITAAQVRDRLVQRFNSLSADDIEGQLAAAAELQNLENTIRGGYAPEIKQQIREGEFPRVSTRENLPPNVPQIRPGQGPSPDGGGGPPGGGQGPPAPPVGLTASELAELNDLRILRDRGAQLNEQSRDRLKELEAKEKAIPIVIDPEKFEDAVKSLLEAWKSGVIQPDGSIVFLQKTLGLDLSTANAVFKEARRRVPPSDVPPGQGDQAAPTQTLSEDPKLIKARRRLKQLIDSGKGKTTFASQLRNRIARLERQAVSGRSGRNFGLWKKRFDAETQIVGPDILAWIRDNRRLLSRTQAKAAWTKEKFKQNASEWDDAHPLEVPHHNLIYSSKGSTPMAKLRKLADGLVKTIQDKRRPMTQNPTPKRNREYRSRLHDADNLERTQRALRALAEAHENGTLPDILDDVTTKDEVYKLVYKGLQGGGYYDVIPSQEYGNKTPKAKALQDLIEAKPKTPEEIAAEQERERLRKIQLLEEKLRFAKIPGFFPTPKAIADDMAKRADIQPGMTVLEPSAGKGDLADAARAAQPQADITTVERLETARDILKLKGYKVAESDFMEHRGQYDRILMNPPFEKGQDIEHVRRAYDQLKPGGKLVAIMSESPFFKTDKKSVEFRDWLASTGGTSEKLDPGAFMGIEAFRQTGVQARIVEIWKPAEVKPAASKTGTLARLRELLSDRASAEGKTLTDAELDQLVIQRALDGHKNAQDAYDHSQEFIKAGRGEEEIYTAEGFALTHNAVAEAALKAGAKEQKPTLPKRPEPRPLTKAEQDEFEKLTLKYRANREEGGPPLTTEETQRYEYLTALAGQLDLLGSGGEPVEAQVKRLREKISELERLRDNTLERYQQSIARRPELMAEVKQYQAEIDRLNGQINDLLRPPEPQPGPDLFGPKEQKPGYGVGNKIVTNADAAKIRDRIKKKGPLSGGKLGTTMDPSLFSDYVQLGVYHLEAGLREFAAWSKAMIDDLGETVRPYLKSIYETAKQIRFGIDGGEDGRGGPDVLRPGERTPLPEILPPDKRIITSREPHTAIVSEQSVPKELIPFLDKHQVQGAARGILALEEQGAAGGALNADGTGVGKTRELLTIGRYYTNQGFKVVIVTRAEAIKPNWNKKTFGGSMYNDSRTMGLTLRLARDGQVNPGEMGVTTYENHADVARNADAKTVLILDEAHSLINMGSARSKSLARAISQARRVAFFTATPADKALHIWYLARVGIYEGMTPRQALERLGLRWVEFQKKDGTWVRHWDIDRRVSKRERETRLSALFDRITAAGRMTKRELSMQGNLVRVLNVTLPPEAQEKLASIPPFFGYRTADDAIGLMKARILMQQRLQQEPWKIAPTVLLARQELAQGRQVVIFVYRVRKSEVAKIVTLPGMPGMEPERRREVLMVSEGTAKTLVQALKDAGIEDIAQIHGDAEEGAIPEMQRFNDGKARVLVATIGSGGTGINLDDIVGNRPRTMIVMTAPFSAVENVQAAGRIWRLKTKSAARFFFLFGDTPVDQWNAAIIGDKMRILGATVEGEIRKLDVTDPDFVSVEDFGVKESSAPGLESEESLTLPQLEWREFKTRSGKIRYVADVQGNQAFWAWWKQAGKNNPEGISVSSWKGRWQAWAGAAPETRQSLRKLTDESSRAPTFYSRITRTVEQSQQKKASGAQWKALIRNSKSGIVRDEYDLVRVEDLEDGKTYTKQEVLDYLKANEIQVKDVTLGESDFKVVPHPKYEGQWAIQKPDGSYVMGAPGSKSLAEGIPANWLSKSDAYNYGIPSYDESRATHYGAYQLPGAKEGSYREVLLTVPEDPNLARGESLARKAEIAGDSESFLKAMALRNNAYNWRDGHSYYANIPNPIVRLRFNERQTADGKRVLFLEEVQPPLKGEFEKMPALFQKNWREIAFKWALRHAVENEFDAVGWTTGEMQVERNDLSKQVDALSYTKRDDGYVLRVILKGRRGEWKELASRVQTADLEKYVGKEVADKIIKGQGDRDEFSGATILRELDLKIGGEGLKRLYDVDFHNVVNNLPAVKKAGQKTGTTTMAIERTWFLVTPGGERVPFTSYQRAAEAAIWRGSPLESKDTPGQVHFLALTPAIRESVLGGQPKFSLTPERGLDPLSEAEIITRLKEAHGMAADAKVRFVNNPESLAEAQSFFYDGELVGIELNRANLTSIADVDRVLEHELSHSIVETGGFRRELQRLTAEEWTKIESDLRDRGYDPLDYEEIAARGVDALVAAWRDRNWFERLVGHVQRVAASLGIKMGRLGAEAAAARALALAKAKELRGMDAWMPGFGFGFKKRESRRLPKAERPEQPSFRDEAQEEELAAEAERALREEEAETPGGIVTEAFGRKDTVRSRLELTPAGRLAGQAAALKAFQQAGLNPTVDPDGYVRMADETTSNAGAGQKLKDILEQVVAQQRDRFAQGIVDDFNGNLLNSVRLMLNRMDIAEDRGQQVAFPAPLRRELYALVQGEASLRGLMLAALRGLTNSIQYVARHVDANLYAVHSNAFGGQTVRAILERIVRFIREEFTEDEIQKIIGDTPELLDLAQRILSANRFSEGGRVYRAVQARLKPKRPKTVPALQKTAREDEAIAEIIEQAKRLGIEETKRPGQSKLTPDERLALMTNPQTEAKIRQAIEIAIGQAELNAGRKQMLLDEKDPDARADLEARFAAGEEPDPAAVEKGLDRPEFAHWKVIRDNLLNYSPTTVKLVQDLLAGRLKGTRFKPPEPKPPDTRIDLAKLAQEPEAEVQRVVQAMVGQIKAIMDLSKATPATIARVLGIVNRNIVAQLEQKRRELRDPMFAEPKARGTPLTPAQRLAKAVNTRLFSDPRLNIPEMVNRVSQKGIVTGNLPNLGALIKATLETPFYRQSDIGETFARTLIEKAGVSENEAQKAAEVFLRAFSTRWTQAKERALNQALNALSPKEQAEARGKKALWKKVVEAVNAGVFDSGPILEAIARSKGWKLPTPREITQMRAWAEEEQRLRELSPAELDKVKQQHPGASPEELQKATDTALAEKIGMFTSRRVWLRHQMTTLWSRWSKPITWWPLGWAPDIRANRARAINEYTGANLIAKIGFAPRQLLDIASSKVFYMPTRAWAHAWQRVENQLSRGESVSMGDIVKELTGVLAEGWVERKNALSHTYRATVESFRGRGELRNVERLQGDIRVFDRSAQRADELHQQAATADAAGNSGKALGLRMEELMIRLFTMVRLGYRWAQALDVFQGMPADYQERRHMVITELLKQGKTRLEAQTAADFVMGDINAEWALAISRAQELADSAGLDVSPSEIKAGAWDIIRSRSYQRMREMGLPADDFVNRIETLKNTIGWNEREDPMSPGGLVIGTPSRLIQSILSKGGLPSFGIGAFGNAMAIAMNRSLQMAGLPFKWLYGKSKWFESEIDAKQRKIEAAVFAPIAWGIMMPLAAYGIIIVRNRWPQNDKEREQWMAEGHKPGTVEFPMPNGKYAAFSLNTGPLAPLRIALSVGGAIHDAAVAHGKKQEAMNEEARKRGLTPGTIPFVTPTMLLGLAGSAGWSAASGGRTATGMLGSYGNWSQFNPLVAIGTSVSSVIPYLPAYQEMARMDGITINPKLANFWDLLVPTDTSDARRVNQLGQPLLNPNAVQRVLSIMTGGSSLGDPAVARENQAMANYLSSDFRAPAINPARGYNFGNEFRPMTMDELQRYTKSRGDSFREELSNLKLEGMSPESIKGEVRNAYRRANAKALSQMGVVATEPIGSNREEPAPRTTGTRAAVRSAGPPTVQGLNRIRRLKPAGMGVRRVSLGSRARKVRYFRGRLRRPRRPRIRLALGRRRRLSIFA